MSVPPMLTHTDRTAVTVRSRDGLTLSGITADIVTSNLLPDGRLRFIFPHYEARLRAALPVAEWWRLLLPTRRRAFKIADIGTLKDGTVVATADIVKPFAAEARDYFENGTDSAEVCNG